MENKFEYQCNACGKPIAMTGYCKRCDDKCKQIELKAENSHSEEARKKQQEIKIEPKFHQRESGFQFTQIVIHKITRNAFVAEFKTKFPNISQVVETSIHSDSVQGVIAKVSDFFQTELTPEEVTVKL